MSSPKVVGRVTAEVMVIVAGVLLALWAEAWREARSERAIGDSYARRIWEDVGRDSLRFERIRFLHQRYREAAEGVLEVLEGARTATPLETAHLLAYAGALAPDNVDTSTYDDLVSSGRLILISDPELRENIQRYYSDLTRRMEALRRAPTALQQLARRWLPGEFAREAQQCLWPQVNAHLGMATLDEEQCDPEISEQQASDVMRRLSARRADVTDLLNEVVWYARDIEYKFRVQERRRASLRSALELALLQ